jgi:hypothetical protein
MFLRLTQKLNSPVDTREVWIQDSHIVGMYPDPSGRGCFVELTTSGTEDGGLLHVQESAFQIVDRLGEWRGFPKTPKEYNNGAT